MDILTHIASGAAAATVVAAFVRCKPGRRMGIVAAGAFGGAMPDVDAVSMWSKFDTTFGRLFSLHDSGRAIYGGKLWYSHHAFFHSLASAILLTVVLGVIGYGVYRIVNKKYTLLEWFKVNNVVAAAFIVGYVAHLLGDLPTPASVWGGIDMFFPSKAYVGGSGKIWWWNNYDIFLLAFLCASVNTALLLSLNDRIRRKTVAFIAAITFILIMVQINTRVHSYAYTGNTHNYDLLEQQSKEEQRRILGKFLYRNMEWLDNRLPLNF